MEVILCRHWVCCLIDLAEKAQIEKLVLKEEKPYIHQSIHVGVLGLGLHQSSHPSMLLALALASR